MNRKPYPSDVSDDEWAFVAPYLTLMTEDAPQREHRLREVFNGLRWIVRAGAAWRLMPPDLPPWHTVYQQSQRWFKAGVFETMVSTCASCCAWPTGVTPSPRPRFSIAARFNRRQRVAGERVLTRPKAAAAPKCIWRSIPWGICWPCW